MNDAENMATAKPGIAGFLRSDVGRAAMKYFLVGGVSALLEWSIFAAFRFGLDQHYLLSGTISFMLATGANYYLSIRFVFGTGSRKREARILLLYFISTVGLGFNLIVLLIGIDVLGAHDMVAKIFATAAVFAWNFIGRYYIVFK